MGIIDFIRSIFAPAPVPSPAPRGTPRPAARKAVGNSRQPPNLSAQPGPAGRSDTLAIAGFAREGFVILPPTRMSKLTDTARVDSIPTRYFRGEGATNLGRGLDRVLEWAADDRSPRCKRAIILTDGEAHDSSTELASYAQRLRNAHMSVSVILIGQEDAPKVRELVKATVGGVFTTANDLATIARRLDAFTRPSARTGNDRRWLNALLIDTSGSMASLLADGRRRIDAVPMAIRSWTAMQRVQHGQ